MPCLESLSGEGQTFRASAVAVHAYGLAFCAFLHGEGYSKSNQARLSIATLSAWTIRRLLFP